MGKTKTFSDKAVLGGVASLQRLIALGADLHERDARGRTALFRVCRLGQTEKTNLLLALGVDPNTMDLRGESPLQSAARYGHLDCVRALLKAGANIDYCPPTELTEYSESVLCSAVRCSTEAARFLLEAGAKPNIVTEAKRYPLVEAVCHHNAELVPLLLQHGASARVCDKHGRTPLHHAAEIQRPDIVELLLQAGANVNACDWHGRTPVHYAIGETAESLAVLRHLLSAAPDLSIVCTINKNTPLERAIYEGAKEAAELLRKAGSPKPSRDEAYFAEMNNGGETFDNSSDSPRLPLVTSADKEIVHQANSLVPSLLIYLDWQASPRHWLMLQAAERQTTIARMAYFVRGCCNRPEGTELDDGPQLLGESYRAAVDRFVQEGFMARAPFVKEVELAFGGDELKALAKQHGLELSGKKADLTARLCEKLSAAAFQQRLDSIDGFYQTTQLGKKFLTRQTNHLDTCLIGLRGQLLAALGTGDIQSAACSARALYLIIPNKYRYHRMLETQNVATARFLLTCSLPTQLCFPPGFECHLRAIMAAQALVDENDADWDTWDTELKSPTTKLGTAVPLRGLSLFIMEQGEYCRANQWESELREQPLFPDETVCYKWHPDQKELRARLGENVVVFAFARQHYRFDSADTIDIVDTEEFFYAVSARETKEVSAPDRDLIAELYKRAKGHLRYEESPLHKRAKSEEQRLLSELCKSPLEGNNGGIHTFVDRLFAMLLSA